MTELRMDEKDQDNTENIPSEVVQEDEIIPMEQEQTVTAEPGENTRESNENPLPNQNNTKSERKQIKNHHLN